MRDARERAPPGAGGGGGAEEPERAPRGERGGRGSLCPWACFEEGENMGVYELARSLLAHHPLTHSERRSGGP